MSALVDDARRRLGELFTRAGVPAVPDDAGDFTIPHGPTTVRVVVSEADGSALIDVWAPILDQVPATPALHRYAAETSFMFGRLCVASLGDGAAQLQISHTFLADPLTEEILVQQLGPVANTAAELAATLPARFAEAPSPEAPSHPADRSRS